MKHLMQQISELFDDYREQVNGAWVNEIKEARTNKVSPDLSNIMSKIPNTPMAKFVRLFNEANERLEAKYKTTKPEKKGLFGGNK